MLLSICCKWKSKEGSLLNSGLIFTNGLTEYNLGFRQRLASKFSREGKHMALEVAVFFPTQRSVFTCSQVFISILISCYCHPSCPDQGRPLLRPAFPTPNSQGNHIHSSWLQARYQLKQKKKMIRAARLGASGEMRRDQGKTSHKALREHAQKQPSEEESFWGRIARLARLRPCATRLH